MTSVLGRGLVAGAVGTTVLNAVGYADMLWRGRPASDAPGQTAEALAERLGRPLTGRGRERDDRRTALGALTGTAAGLAVGVAASAARSAGLRFSPPVGAAVTGAAAMALADVPMAALGVSDPRTWTSTDWVSDAVPHLAYGIATHATVASLARQDPTARPVRRAGPGLTARSALLGVAAGSRSTLGFAAPTLTAGRASWRTEPRPSAARRAAVALAVLGEMTADKLPATPSRLLPPSLAGRFSTGAGGALALARRESANGVVPAVAGALGTAAGSWGGYAWREWASTRMSTLRSGLLEDAVALSLAAAACLTSPRRPADLR